MLENPRLLVNMENQLRFWEKEPANLDKLSIPSNKEVVRQILSVFGGKVEKKRILEVGAGTGADSIYLAKLGADVYCLDYSRSSMRVIKNCAKEKGLFYT